MWKKETSLIFTSTTLMSCDWKALTKFENKKSTSPSLIMKMTIVVTKKTKHFQGANIEYIK